MIKLVAIVGESYDLETGQETPKKLRFSNGIREVAITVSDEDVREIIMLQIEEQKGGTRAVVPTPISVAGPVFAATQRLVEPEPEPAFQVGVAEVADAPSDDDPGVDYNDPMTGTPSI